MITFSVYWFIICLIIAAPTSYIWGTQKHIGWQWCFLLCMLFPVGGIIATLISPNISNPKPKSSIIIKYIGMCFLLLGGLGALGILLEQYSNKTYDANKLLDAYKGAGIALYGYYIMLVGKGEKLNYEV